MTTHYVNVLGSYDSTFVGPFLTHEDATRFKSRVPKQFDVWVLSQRELDANFEEFGKAKIESPHTYDMDSDYAFTENR
jgi:hypothetical protein